MNILEMTIHQEYFFDTKDNQYYILSVPGGWIYTNTRTGSCCFVPLFS